MTGGRPAAEPGRGGHTRQVAANASWLTAERLVGMATAAAVAVVLARTYGPEQFGAYSGVLSVALIASDLAGLGFALVITHEVLARPRDERSPILGSALTIRIVAAVLVTAVCAAGAGWISSDDGLDWSVLAILACLPLIRTFEVFEFAHQADQRGRALFMARAATSVVAALAVVLLIVDDDPPLWAAAATDMLRYAVYLAIVTYLAMRVVGRLRVERAEVAYLLRRALPLALPALAFAINLRIDQVMLAGLASDLELGLYAAAVRIAEVVYFLPIVLITAMQPRLTALRADEREFDRVLSEAYGLMFAMGTGLAAAMILFAPIALEVVFGAEFAGGVAMLRILALALPFVFMRAVFARWMVLTDNLQLTLLTTGTAAGVNIALNLVLIPEFGGIGAAWATVTAYVFSGYVVLGLVPSTRPSFRHINRGIRGAPRAVVLRARELLDSRR